VNIGIRNESLEKNLEVVRKCGDHLYNWIKDCSLKPRDTIIVTRDIAGHGVAIMFSREFDLKLEVESDMYPVWLFLQDILKVREITAMEDPTGVGFVNTLNELAEKNCVEK